MSAGLHSDPAILKPLQDTPRAVQPRTVDQLAAEANVSRRLMFLCLKAHRAGCAELITMMRDGRVTANLAAVLVDLFPNHDDQRTVIAEFHDIPPRGWLGFARRVHELTKGRA